jgi:hypothetical protein
MTVALKAVRYLMVTAGVLAQAWFVAPAAAEMVATEAVVLEAQASEARAKLEAQLARPEVAKRLQDYGVSPENAVERVRAMSDAEVRMLARAVDQLPAGGALTNTELLLILVLIILIAILI